eukprot:TRINITY_DN58803_c0_g1_i1.p1 TRINITY_DN58803_c0_g1~~TRINITY_DN58803_c0_g1_i1.p1  ORF type:complete len:356 (-),score=52.99 TRINITY_DN58803_c0_g1_i1:3-1070(-)
MGRTGETRSSISKLPTPAFNHITDTKPSGKRQLRYLPTISVPRRSDFVLNRISRDREVERRLPPIHILTNSSSSSYVVPMPSLHTEFDSVSNKQKRPRRDVGTLHEQESVAVVAESRQKMLSELLPLSQKTRRKQQIGTEMEIALNDVDDGHSPTRKARKATRNFDQCVALAKKHNIKLPIVKELLDEFQGMDANGDGVLSFEEFEVAVQKRYNLADQEDAEGLDLAKQWKMGDRVGSNSVTFEGFLLWNFGSHFTEQLAITDDTDRKLRKLARELEISYEEIDRIKRSFEKFDTDNSGFIDKVEFKTVVLDMFGARSSGDFLQKRLQLCWEEADMYKTGEIDLEAFVRWYVKMT